METGPEVVITGVGVVSPIGVGKDDFWTSIMEGRSGVGTHPELNDDYDTPFQLASGVNDFDAKLYVKPRKSLKVMCRQIQLGVAAANLAVQDAQLVREGMRAERIGTVYGSELFYGDPREMEPTYRSLIEEGFFDSTGWADQAARNCNPLAMLKYLPNMAASHIAIAHDARGPCNSIIHQDVSSLLAVIEGIDLIRRGWVDTMVTGGTGSRMAVAGLAYHGLRTLSKRTDAPQSTPRPFDADRDGYVLGEGAGSMILENRAVAEARGAAIYARVAGYDRGFWMSKREPVSAAIARCISKALKKAGIEARHVGHYNADGTAVPEADIEEAKAILEVLGDVPVTAPKSYYGCLGGGGGAIETIASVVGLEQGVVPRSLNFETPDPACPVNVVTTNDHRPDHQSAVCINISPVGQIAVLVLVRD